MALLSSAFPLVGWGFWLARFHLLTSAGKVVFVSVGMAILMILTLRHARPALPLRGLAVFLLAYGAFLGLWPWLMQELIASPDELEKERYAPTGKLQRQALEANQPTITNIRLWDYRPILSTYRKLQETRLYYQFQDVDIDRYTLAGLHQQGMLSARELAF
jgi:hypothetical protein